MLTITLTEAEAARVCYAMEREASEYSLRINNIRRSDNLSIASGRNEIIAINGRDECLSIRNKIEAAR